VTNRSRRFARIAAILVEHCNPIGIPRPAGRPSSHSSWSTLGRALWDGVLDDLIIVVGGSLSCRDTLRWSSTSSADDGRCGLRPLVQIFRLGAGIDEHSGIVIDTY